MGKWFSGWLVVVKFQPTLYEKYAQVKIGFIFPQIEVKIPKMFEVSPSSFFLTTYRPKERIETLPKKPVETFPEKINYNNGFVSGNWWLGDEMQRANFQGFMEGF